MCHIMMGVGEQIMSGCDYIDRLYVQMLCLNYGEGILRMLQRIE